MNAPSLNDAEGPVAIVWRKTLSDIVSAFVRDDFELKTKIPRVEMPTADLAAQMRSYVADYGETLVELPEETWKTSVAIGMESHWDVLVDLWTEESGRSDMVVHLDVFESGGEYAFKIHLLYVP